jgi:hypothetical protein
MPVLAGSQYGASNPPESLPAHISGVAVLTQTGGCHGGRVRFEVWAPTAIEVLDSNCSVCSKTGFVHPFSQSAGSNRAMCRARIPTATASTHVAAIVAR